MNVNTILIDSPDQPGLVAHITGTFFKHGLNIISNHEFVEPDTARFFMRSEVEGEFDATQLLSELQEHLPLGGSATLANPMKKRIVVFASKESHCLGDLLVRCSFNEMHAEIVAVIANHDVLRNLVEQFAIPFHHVPHEDKAREGHEQEMLEIAAQYNPEYLVLAKYMRILTPGFIAPYEGRIINIHHSFLPAFIGAQPYRQAYERGVKIIGATAHFVNNALDEGPIIEQQVNQIGHQMGPKEMAFAGKDIEKIVLARALNLVFNDRVFVSGNKTIIFE